MTATTAADPNGVEYFFEHTPAAATTAAGRTAPPTSTAGLAPGTTYGYRVRARDKSPNQNLTGFSATELGHDGCDHGDPGHRLHRTDGERQNRGKPHLDRRRRRGSRET